MKQNEKKEQLKVNIQYIKDLSFENQNSPDSLSNKGEAPAINVDMPVIVATFTIFGAAISYNTSFVYLSTEDHRQCNRLAR